ncbi:MAG: RidA family protein [Pseudomonadota bacterium]
MDEIIAQRLESEGISLTVPPKPVASYVGYVQHGDLVFISGQLPLLDGELASAGLLGKDLTVEEGIQAARVCGINLLNQINAACDGDLGRVERCVRLGVFVASTPDFTDQPKVANGASELMGSIFADKGAHARAAVGVASLPLNASVEVEGIFAIS